MVRPRIQRHLRFSPHVDYFKPRGVPLRHLSEVVLRADELEAIKLYEIDGLDQKQAAEKMGISQPTFQRTLSSARKKIAKAIIHGLAIRIEHYTDNVEI